MRKIILQNKIRLLCFLLVMLIGLVMFTPPALAWSENSYEKKLAATVDNRISVEAELNIPNYVGTLKLELPVEGNVKETDVYVVNPKDYVSAAVEVKLTGADCPIYYSYLYPTGFEYNLDAGFCGAFQGGDGYSSKEGGEVRLFSGLNNGQVYFYYSLEPLGYDSLEEMSDDVIEENIYQFWIGAPYILVLYDEDIEYFLANDEIRELEGYEWPGLRELLTGASTSGTPSSTNNFTVKNTYTQGQFADVSNQWYADSVKKVYEIGLMKGNSVGNFNPEGTITLAEAVTMAARLHSIYNGGSGDFTQGSPWYGVYVDYAIENGIIQQNDFNDFNLAATRGEMTYIFASALPIDELVQINKVTSLPDVKSGTRYHDSIFLLYRAGVITGNDSIGTFAPETNITRAQAAAIITRIALPAERKSLDF